MHGSVRIMKSRKEFFDLFWQAAELFQTEAKKSENIVIANLGKELVNYHSDVPGGSKFLEVKRGGVSTSEMFNIRLAWIPEVKTTHGAKNKYDDKTYMFVEYVNWKGSTTRNNWEAAYTPTTLLDKFEFWKAERRFNKLFNKMKTQMDLFQDELFAKKASNMMVEYNQDRIDDILLNNEKDK